MGVVIKTRPQESPLHAGTYIYMYLSLFFCEFLPRALPQPSVISGTVLKCTCF